MQSCTVSYDDSSGAIYELVIFHVYIRWSDQLTKVFWPWASALVAGDLGYVYPSASEIRTDLGRRGRGYSSA